MVVSRFCRLLETVGNASPRDWKQFFIFGDVMVRESEQGCLAPRDGLELAHGGRETAPENFHRFVRL